MTLKTVEEFKKKPRTFDTILSISSFEHDGLGRYGDPLDPYGDLRAMKSCLNMLKPGGKLILSVPVGSGCLVWNIHRIYGAYRLSKLLNDWRLVDYRGAYQSMFSLPEGNYYEEPVFLLEPDNFLRDRASELE